MGINGVGSPVTQWLRRQNLLILGVEVRWQRNPVNEFTFRHSIHCVLQRMERRSEVSVILVLRTCHLCIVLRSEQFLVLVRRKKIPGIRVIDERCAILAELRDLLVRQEWHSVRTWKAGGDIVFRIHTSWVRLLSLGARNPAPTLTLCVVRAGLFQSARGGGGACRCRSERPWHLSLRYAAEPVVLARQ